MASLRRKLVIVGDQGVGKSALFKVVGGERFSKPHATILETRFHDIKLFDGRVLQLRLEDTGGHADFERTRPASYRDAAVIIVAFSVDSFESFEHAKERWVPEVVQYNSRPKVPFLLVGCKSDLRNSNTSAGDSSLRPTSRRENVTGRVRYVTAERGAELAKDIGAAQYFECSAKTKEGLEALMSYAGRLASRWDPTAVESFDGRKEVRCLIL